MRIKSLIACAIIGGFCMGFAAGNINGFVKGVRGMKKAIVYNLNEAYENMKGKCESLPEEKIHACLDFISPLRYSLENVNASSAKNLIDDYNKLSDTEKAAINHF